MSLRERIVRLHVGQLTMLLIACAAAVCIAGMGAMAAAAGAMDASDRVRRARDYSFYEKTGEHRLSDAELWDKRMREYGTERWQATIYVANRPRGALDSLLESDGLADSTTARPGNPALVRAYIVEGDYRRAAFRWRVIGWALLLAATAPPIFAWWVLWVWFGGRRQSSRI